MLPSSIMLQEIREQPALLASAGRAVRRDLDATPEAWDAIRSLHLVGCGDMDFAARTAAGLAVRGRPIVEAHASMDLRWKAADLSREDLVVAASFSGRTPRTIEAARLARKRGARVIGLTGNAASPLAQSVDRVLLVPTDPEEEMARHVYAGYLHIVPQTKSFTAMLLAMLLLVERSGRLDPEDRAALEGVPRETAGFLARLEASLDAFLAQGLPPVARVAVLASGPWRGLGSFGAAKLLEMAVPARTQCLEENNHLEMFVTQSDDLLVLLAPDGPSFDRARELIEPYGRFGAPRLLFALGARAGWRGPLHVYAPACCGIPLLAQGRVLRIFESAVALELLAACLGPALGRDIDQWVGGVRTKLIEEMGLKLVRGSEIREDY